jgi:excisionase family DNA binding protein
MLTLSAAVPEVIPPTDQETQIARTASAVLTSLISSAENSPAHLSVCAREKEEARIALPPSVIRLLLNALQEMAKGNAVTLLPIPKELTTQQAADMLGVSRPFLLKLLEEEKIPSRLVGTQHHVLYQDVLYYAQQERIRREQVMEALVAETESLGLYK